MTLDSAMLIRTIIQKELENNLQHHQRLLIQREDVMCRYISEHPYIRYPYVGTPEYRSVMEAIRNNLVSREKIKSALADLMEMQYFNASESSE